MDTKKLEVWLRSELCKAKPPEKLVLRTAAPGARGTPVETFEIETRLELEEIPVLANNILARAQDDANGNGPNVHRYILLSFRKEEGKPSAKHSFRLRGESDLDFDEEAGDEPANLKGMLTQFMRHNEAMTRTVVQSTSALTAIMVRRLESSDRTIQKLIEERNENFKVLEEARSEQHNREIEAHLITESEKRKDQAFQKLMALVPMVLNKLAGGKVLPDKSDPLMMLLEPLIGSMTAEQFQAIQGTLNPEQSLMFVDLLQTFQKRKQLTETSATKEN